MTHERGSLKIMDVDYGFRPIIQKNTGLTDVIDQAFDIVFSSHIKNIRMLLNTKHALLLI